MPALSACFWAFLLVAALPHPVSAGSGDANLGLNSDKHLYANTSSITSLSVSTTARAKRNHPTWKTEIQRFTFKSAHFDEIRFIKLSLRSLKAMSKDARLVCYTISKPFPKWYVLVATVSHPGFKFFKAQSHYRRIVYRSGRLPKRKHVRRQKIYHLYYPVFQTRGRKNALAFARKRVGYKYPFFKVVRSSVMKIRHNYRIVVFTLRVANPGKPNARTPEGTFTPMYFSVNSLDRRRSSILRKVRRKLYADYPGARIGYSTIEKRRNSKFFVTAFVKFAQKKLQGFRTSSTRKGFSGLNAESKFVQKSCRICFQGQRAENCRRLVRRCSEKEGMSRHWFESDKRITSWYGSLQERLDKRTAFCNGFVKTFVLARQSNCHVGIGNQDFVSGEGLFLEMEQEIEKVSPRAIILHQELREVDNTVRNTRLPSFRNALGRRLVPFLDMYGYFKIYLPNVKYADIIERKIKERLEKRRGELRLDSLRFVQASLTDQDNPWARSSSIGNGGPATMDVKLVFSLKKYI